MSDARNDILSEVRAAVSIAGKKSNNFEAKKRLVNHPVNIIPARGNLGKKALVDLFIREAERVSASVARVSCLAGVPGEVGRFLAKNNLPKILKIAPELSKNQIPWSDQAMLRVEEGRADGTDESSVNLAFAGVAETGTLVLLSGRSCPTTLSFLPPNHICLVHMKNIVGDYEEVWARIREVKIDGETLGLLPRAVNWITGPSRTADIEQTLLLGAHGTQRLHIVIIND